MKSMKIANAKTVRFNVPIHTCPFPSFHDVFLEMRAHVLRLLPGDVVRQAILLTTMQIYFQDFLENWCENDRERRRAIDSYRAKMLLLTARN